jgi:Leucine-rich repeat (LRR) protein
MTRTDSSALLSRLKKIHAEVPDEYSVKIALDKPDELRKISVLTPSYLQDTAHAPQAALKMLKRDCEIRADLSELLPEILASASPFSMPLSVGKLIDLLFCELRSSQILEARIREKTPFLFPLIETSRYRKSEPGKARKRTSFIIPSTVDSYITSLFQINPKSSLSLFLCWVISDWEFISQRLSFKGFRPP